MDPRTQLAVIAASQLGTEEDSAHTNRGAAIAKYQSDTSLGGQGWPWCAAFVDWCVHQFLLQHASTTKVPLAHRPQTAAAFGLRTWGADNGCLIHHDAPQPGDLVVYTFSHCGIVERAIDAHAFVAIEGNSNNDGSRDGYEVVRKTHPDRCRVLCFVRLPLA
jgi:hypothetical protein